MKTTLQPLIHRDSYTGFVEAEITSYLSETIYNPLIELLHSEGLRTNENKEHSAVWDAIIAGTLWYAAGVFTGIFDAAISRELRAMGAKFTANGFVLPIDEIPISLRGALALSNSKSRTLHRTVQSTLDEMQENILIAATGMLFSDIVDKITEDLQGQLVRTVSAEASLPTLPKTPQGLIETLKESLTGEMTRAIKQSALEQINYLRAKVLDNLQNGGRTDRLAELIRAYFGVAKRRARLIAEYGTGQLVSDFRETSYEALGSTEYVWDTSHDEKVRADHRALDGRVFSWSNPPIADRATGFRGHPGHAANCRCSARPIINFA